MTNWPREQWSLYPRIANPPCGCQTRNETPFVGLVEENAGDLRKANPAAISKRKAGLHPPARDSVDSETSV